MSGFMLEQEGPPGVFAIFSEDEGAGYFFVYQPETRTVLAQVRIYVCSRELPVNENDIRVMWSSDRKKCGATIWGKMRGIIDIANGREICFPLEAPDSPAVTDPLWLKGFDNCLDQAQFIRARQRYWKKLVKQHKPDAQPLPEEQTPMQTNFIVSAKGPKKSFAVFEDDGECGYLYLYDSTEQIILRFLHIYDRSERVDVASRDVEVKWAAGFAKCGVAIWGKMRGVIDLVSGREGRVWLESRGTPGIGDKEWLHGFMA